MCRYVARSAVSRPSFGRDGLCYCHECGSADLAPHTLLAATLARSSLRGDRRSGAAAKAEFDARWQELRVAPRGSTVKAEREAIDREVKQLRKDFPLIVEAAPPSGDVVAPSGSDERSGWGG